MFGGLTEKIQSAIASLRGNKVLTEENVAGAVSQVRVALLEADVNYSVVKKLVQRIKEKALGQEVVKTVTADQQFIKIVHDALVELMGGEEKLLHLKDKPAVIMLAGLQGSGKTTHAAKLAKYLLKENPKRKLLLVACDLQRPAAVQQLQTLGRQVGVDVFTLPGAKDPVFVAKEAMTKARDEGVDVVILDTAGRLHIDDELMEELAEIKRVTKPQEVLFVANATTGQDAVQIAREFHGKVEITGTILTLLDGNTRGGAAISICEVTGRPLKFEGIGEKIDDIQVFNPVSMADRILGMGDTINLVKKAQEHFDEEDAKKLEKKLRTATFTFKDYLKQIQMVKKMGSFSSLFAMLPGASALKGLQIDDKEFTKIEAMILSMTEEERDGLDDLSFSRKKRVASGSGVQIDDVNKLAKSFKQAKVFFKNMPNQKQLEKMMGGARWR